MSGRFKITRGGRSLKAFSILAVNLKADFQQGRRVVKELHEGPSSRNFDSTALVFVSLC